MKLCKSKIKPEKEVIASILKTTDSFVFTATTSNSLTVSFFCSVL